MRTKTKQDPKYRYLLEKEQRQKKRAESQTLGQKVRAALWNKRGRTRT